MLNRLLKLDHRLTERIQLPEQRGALRALAAVLAHSGDSWYWLAGLFLIWLFTSGHPHKFSALLAGAILIQATLVLAIKFLIRRQRPAGQWGEIYRKTDPHSFPSGHAARAAMLAALAWGFHLAPLNWVLTLWAPLMSVARVSLGVHYLVDILAGWILGLVIAILFIQTAPFFLQWFPFFF